jgi:diacylglycerol kinase (ATP)
VTRAPGDGPVQIVVTPGSGEGRAKITARRLRRLLRRRGRASRVETFTDLTALLRWASTCEADFSCLVCIGGDATLSAAALASVRTGVPLVPVPNGFGNVFASVFGHGAHPGAVVRLLATGQVRRVDVGVVTSAGGEELFLSHRSYGMLEQIQQAAERGRKQPRRRLLRYLWYWAVAYRFFFRTRLASFEVHVDGAPVGDDAVLVTIANVETYRGFLPLTPTASPIDGLFDVFVMRRAPKAVLMLRLLRLLLGTPGRWRGTALYRGRRVLVRTGRREDEMTVRRRALPLLVPPGAIEALGRRTVADPPPIASV